MSSPPPLSFRYEGEGEWKPSSKFVASRADGAYVIGMDYILVPHEPRSQRSHNHFFAAVKNAWDNLPDHMLMEYPTTEHLRKKALIKKGYADERSVVCASKAEAQRVAAFVKPMDEYAIVVPVGSVVKVYTAQSQSMRAMNKEVFQKSKTDVLDFIDDLLGVDREATSGNANPA